MRVAATEVTNAVTDAAAHLGIDLADYDTRIRTFIPDYAAMQDIVADALRASLRRQAPLIAELGIGTGALAARCLEALPSARVIGLDADAAMLAAARARLGDRLGRTLHGSFETIALPRCDAFVAAFALHHVPTAARRLRLFRRLHGALHRGGVLVSADCHPQTNPRLAAADRRAWLAHLEAAYTPEAARGYLRAWARDDHYATLADEIATLRRAGFTVDVPGCKHGFAVIVATK